jgi:hypothetical protein
MPWAKFDDRYPWHRKVRPLSDAAFRLDVSAVCWCAENLTDGLIEPEHLTLVSDVKRPSKAAAELVKTGRWHGAGHDCPSCPDVSPGAYVIHDYLDFNPTREKVEKDREERRKAGRIGGRASGESRSREANTKQVASDLPSKTEATAASSPTNPRTRTPSPTTTSVEGGSHVSRAVDNSPPLYADRCKAHGDDPTPDPCGRCADVRKANAVRPLTLVPSPSKRCLVHDETYTVRCRGCRADEIAAEDAS